MYDIHCHHCHQRFLVGARSMLSMHNTSEGPIAYVRCPNGHHVVRRFRVAADDPAGTEQAELREGVAA